MKKIFALAVAAFFSVGVTYAQTSAPIAPSGSKAAPATVAASSCEARAVDKNGKPLAGADKPSFVKKCESGNNASAAPAGEGKAGGQNGKPLAGPPTRQSLEKMCAQ